jgi:hypothetical protein
MSSRVAGAVLAVVLSSCHHPRRADLQIVLHAKETPNIFHVPSETGGITARASFSIHWSIDLVETAGRECTVTAIEVVIRVPGRPDRIIPLDATSPFLYGVTYDSWSDQNRRFDPIMHGYGVGKASSTEWYVAWVNDPPDFAGIVVDVAVTYRDSDGERVSRAAFGPGLTLES